MNLTLFVTGFPTQDHPSRGIFNFRAAEGLCRQLNLTVIHVRLYRPGRHLIRTVDGYPWTHIELSLPLLPIIHRRRFQEYLTIIDWILGRGLGRLLCRSRLENTNIFHSVGAAFSGPVCADWARRWNAFHVMQLVGSDVNFELPRLVRTHGGHRWMKWVDGIAANSRDLAAKYVVLDPNAPLIRTVYRGTDLAVFKPGKPISEDRTVFLYLGGLPSYAPAMHGMNQKGGVTLMNAWRAFETDAAAARSVLIFAGPGARCPDAEHWYQSLRHPERVILRDALKPDDIPGLMNEASIVVIPSMAEGLPNIGMEALACGRPLIGSRTGGIPELVVPEVTGWLFNPGDERDLARVMGVAASVDAHRLAVLGSAARDRAAHLFDSEKYVPSLMNLYRDVMETERKCVE
ncbi:MAG TPA: glycosyltransferase family 4 protein [bacterium]|nr:glycosyltransferase family 4 protein [bacterium]